MEHLYFIAVVPPEDIRNKVTRIKEEFKDNYHSQHALKSPPHITLHMPFKWKEKKIQQLDDILKYSAKETAPFSITIKNFGSFEPRVIFLAVEESPELNKLQQRIRTGMKKLHVLNANYKERHFHPHMTVAFRDLRKKKFFEAWERYKKEQISLLFSVKSLFLLRHNGKFWELYKEYPFNPS